MDDVCLSDVCNDITLELLSLGGVYPQSKHMNNSLEYSKLQTRYAQSRDYRNLCGTYVTHLRLFQIGAVGSKKNIVVGELKYWWIYERS